MKICVFLLSLLLLKCNNDIKKDFKLSIFEKSKKFTPHDTLKFKLENKKNHLIKDNEITNLFKKFKL